jgi:hypothetical protein
MLNHSEVMLICILPPRRYFSQATRRLIADVGRFCEELGFEVASVWGLGSFVAALLRGDCGCFVSWCSGSGG